MAEPDGLISIAKLVITLQTGPSLTVCILSLAFQGLGSWHEVSKCNVIKKRTAVNLVV